MISLGLIDYFRTFWGQWGQFFDCLCIEFKALVYDQWILTYVSYLSKNRNQDRHANSSELKLKLFKIYFGLPKYRMNSVKYFYFLWKKILDVFHTFELFHIKKERIMIPPHWLFLIELLLLLYLLLYYLLCCFLLLTVVEVVDKLLGR